MYRNELERLYMFNPGKESVPDIIMDHAGQDMDLTANEENEM